MRRYLLMGIVIFLLAGLAIEFRSGIFSPEGNRVAAPIVREETFLAFVRSILDDAGQPVLMLDDAVWLTGEDADAAARADGFECEMPSCLPNGFYIDNENATPVAYALAPEAVITIIVSVEDAEMPLQEREISFEEFVGLYNDTSSAKAVLPYDATVRDGLLVKLAERYVP